MEFLQLLLENSNFPVISQLALYSLSTTCSTSTMENACKIVCARGMPGSSLSGAQASQGTRQAMHWHHSQATRGAVPCFQSAQVECICFTWLLQGTAYGWFNCTCTACKHACVGRHERMVALYVARNRKKTGAVGQNLGHRSNNTGTFHALCP